MTSHISLDELFRGGTTAALGVSGAEAQRVVSLLRLDPGVTAVRGRMMKDWEGLYNEFWAAYQFPTYFGRNLEAFVESLSEPDLDPRSASQICLVLDPELVLADAPADELPRLRRMLSEVNRRWQEHVEGDVNGPPGTFAVLLVPNGAEDEPVSRWQSAGADIPRLTGTP